MAVVAVVNVVGDVVLDVIGFGDDFSSMLFVDVTINLFDFSSMLKVLLCDDELIEGVWDEIGGEVVELEWMEIIGECGGGVWVEIGGEVIAFEPMEIIDEGGGEIVLVINALFKLLVGVEISMHELILIIFDVLLDADDVVGELNTTLSLVNAWFKMIGLLTKLLLLIWHCVLLLCLCVFLLLFFDFR